MTILLSKDCGVLLIKVDLASIVAPNWGKLIRSTVNGWSDLLTIVVVTRVSAPGAAEKSSAIASIHSPAQDWMTLKISFLF